MIYLLSALAVGGFIFLAFLSLYMFVECGFLYKIVAVIYWIASLAAFLYFIGVQINENPYVKYETRVQINENPETKTMMPMRICMEYGEWVE